MNFYFFVQIALLWVDSVVGPAELFPPQGNIVAPALDNPVDEEPSWKAAPQVPLPYHLVNRVTSADTLELQHKTSSHLQQSFSELGSTVFGRLLMNFYFFVQIALLRVGFRRWPGGTLPTARKHRRACAWTAPSTKNHHGKQRLQVPLPYHVVKRLTSADTLELQHKTRSHLQQSFSRFGSTVFGRLLMNFYFFVQIALLRVDSVVGSAELFPPQGNIVANAPDNPVDEEPSWKAAPEVPLPYHVVNRVTSPCCGWIPSLARRNSSHRKETSSRLHWTTPSTKNHHGKQRLKCPSPTIWSNRVTSADTLELQHKTSSHLQQSFSELGSTVFGRLLMNFYFFVQIALLRVDSVVGPAELFPPQGNIVAPAPDNPVDEESSWKAAPQVALLIMWSTE
ncbi:hypothetical protein MRX96_000018 [Rhipicephalus microplus]